MRRVYFVKEKKRFKQGKGSDDVMFQYKQLFLNFVL